MLDFSKDVEAVHESGRVSKARMGALGGKRVVHIDALGDNWYVSEDGYIRHDWRILNVISKQEEMFVRVTFEQFDRLQRCFLAFDAGLPGPDGWTAETVKTQLAYWAIAHGGHYNRFRHDNGESVRLEVLV